MKRKRFKFKIGDVVRIRPDAELPDPPDDPYRKQDQIITSRMERLGGWCPLYYLEPYYSLVSEDYLEGAGA
jgi:hypothetical protein